MKKIIVPVIKGSLKALGIVIPQNWAAILGHFVVDFALECLVNNPKSPVKKKDADPVKKAIEPEKKN